MLRFRSFETLLYWCAGRAAFVVGVHARRDEESSREGQLRPHEDCDLRAKSSRADAGMPGIQGRYRLSASIGLDWTG